MYTITTLLLALAVSTIAQITVTPGGSCGTQPGIPPAGRNRFELLTVPDHYISGGNVAPYSGLFLKGIGQLPSLSNNQSAATIFKFHEPTGDIYYNYQETINGKNETAIYSLKLFPGELSAPGLPATGLSPLDFRPGFSNSNFSFDATTNLVKPPCGAFTVCALSPGVFQLFGSYGPINGTCTDVRLKAVDRF